MFLGIIFYSLETGTNEFKENCNSEFVSNICHQNSIYSVNSFGCRSSLLFSWGFFVVFFLMPLGTEETVTLWDPVCP